MKALCTPQRQEPGIGYHLGLHNKPYTSWNSIADTYLWDKSSSKHLQDGNDQVQQDGSNSKGQLKP